MESPKVQSLWDNIILSSGVTKSSRTQKLCLENVVKLYLKVCAFSYAKDYITISIGSKKRHQRKKDLERT